MSSHRRLDSVIFVYRSGFSMMKMCRFLLCGRGKDWKVITMLIHFLLFRLVSPIDSNGKVVAARQWGLRKNPVLSGPEITYSSGTCRPCIALCTSLTVLYSPPSKGGSGLRIETWGLPSQAPDTLVALDRDGIGRFKFGWWHPCDWVSSRSGDLDGFTVN